MSLPSQVRCIVIGGGIIGNSIAYHLAKMGMKDVLLLEQSQLTSGTSWHAAGLMVTFGSLSQASVDIRTYTRDLYSGLERETGHSTGFKPVGFIELATDTDRLQEFRRIAAFNRKFGVDVIEISPDEVKAKFPICKTDDVLAGFYVESDGRVNPIDATISLSKGAKLHGAKIIEGISVDFVNTKRSNSHLDEVVTGVTLTTGETIDCEYVVNCTGMWARQLSDKNNVIVPNQAAEHYYLITDKIDEVNPNWPVIEDPNSYTYIRPEGNGLMIGLFEGEAAAWNVDRIPTTFSFDEIHPDLERISPYLEKAMNRVPISLTAGIKKLFCGPESFTPDGNPVIGETPEIQNYFVAAGMNSVGILTGGGIGRLLAHWIIHGKPDVDVTSIHVDRFHKYQVNPLYRKLRVVETLSNVYKCHYPYKSHESARGVKRSPFVDKLTQHGAYFKEVSGWEGADWFDVNHIPLNKPKSSKHLIPSVSKHSFDKSGMLPWFNYWELEHITCRESVVLMDMSFMSKFLVQGKDSGKFLNYLSTANVDQSVNTITYTQWLNESGTLEADVTVCKLSYDKFLVIATDTSHRHVESWMRRHCSPDSHCFITDVTGLYSQLNIQGPQSRELLTLLTDTNMSNEYFPFRCVKEISIGLGRVLCSRITYVGELGYELFIPVEFSLHIYELIMNAGRELNPLHGIKHAGLKALNSLRLEKGYRDYGHDIDNTDNIFEVGLSFTIDLKKPNGFIGKDKIIEQKSSIKSIGGMKSRLVHVLVQDSSPMLFHGEIIYRDNECIGDIRSGSYGHTLKGAVALGYISIPSLKNEVFVNKDFVSTGKWEVDIAGIRYPIVVSLEPFYDPKNSRIKG